MNKISLIQDIETLLKDISETPYLDAKFFVDACERQGTVVSDDLINDFIERRRQGEPVSKIVETRGFWALDFYVTKDVLDPRADSETLIEAVLKHIPNKEAQIDILDIGTGSGCLLLSLLYEYKNAKGTGVDVSDKALMVAQKNGLGYSACFFKKNLYHSDFQEGLTEYDVIVSNPPYIKTKDIEKLDKNVRLYDPLIALDGGEDGLDAYRALSTQIKPVLKQEGFVFFEIGQGQEDDVIQIMKLSGFSFVASYKDLSEIVRVLVFSHR